jgi:1,2-diacylglycerol 3-alpha-glucosyltransferase
MPIRVAITGPESAADAPSSPVRVAVIFVNYGPYHLTRAGALALREDVDPIFIELASAQRKYTWEIEKGVLGERLITLVNRPYEDCGSTELNRIMVTQLNRLRPHTVVIAGYSDPPMRIAAKWARAADAGVVLMSESTEGDHNRLCWKEWIKRFWIHRYVDTAFAGGQRSRAYLTKLGMPDRRIWERYDVVDNSYFASRVQRLRAQSAKQREHVGLPLRYFLYVGRFAPEKNLVLLLRGYRRYRELHSGGWGLVMVGDGPQSDEIREAAEAEGLTQVVWTGYKQFDELPLYYAFAGCFILPSAMEPWGLVVNEAMACGLPVIVSSRCGCAPDLVQDGRNGFTFEPTQSEQLGKLMVTVAELNDEERAAMGQFSAEIISHWTPEIWASQLACAIQAATSLQRFSPAHMR